jgi:tetratricopeptide (TPR) repeat protein
MKKNTLPRPVPWLLFSLLIVLLAFTAALARETHTQHDHSSDPSRGVTLLDGLIDLQFPITTDSQAAQDFFNQGLVLTYGFDHSDAEVSYQEAARHDPNAAMAYWGLAFVLGPNINAPMNAADGPRAYALTQKALALAKKASAKERALIEALATRYATEAPADRSSLDQAFADAMRQVYRRFPADPNVAALFAESLMDLHPWNYWTEDDQAQPWTPEIRTVLEKLIAENPRHPHGHHLYIHLLENSPTPEATIKSADVIRNLVPAAGHLVHMAGHAYYAAGLYHDCSVVNEEAIGVDKVIKATFDTEGLYQLAYMPHNLHFLLASYMMEGRSREAVAVARTLSAGVDQKMMRQPGLESLQQFYLTPYYTLVRFGRWDELLAESAPPADLKYPRALWHYARGIAFTRKGDTGRAEAELVQLKALAADASLAGMKIWGLNRVSDLLGVAVEALAGEIAAARGAKEEALAHFERGVALQDKLAFDEPPTWYYPVRQSLGTLFLDLGRPKEAEAVFRKDLQKNPENAWALYGLTQSLKAQGKNDLAADMEQRFRRAWSRADVKMNRPVF